MATTTKTKVKTDATANTPEPFVAVPTINPSVVEGLQKQIAELKALLEDKTEKLEVAPLEQKAPEANGVPIPADFRTVVDENLNKRFGVEIEYSSNTPFFGFSILVPKEYSNAAKPHWDMYGEDRRTRMVSNAEGLQGVKVWVERVYNNFDNETKARITSDRHNEHG